MVINKFKFLLLGALCSLSMMNGQNKKYSWLGSVSAPQEYPVEIYRGAIAANDFTYDFDASLGTQNTGWGNEGNIRKVKTEKMDLPHQLEFTWYSLTEKKFYTGKWNLNKSNIKKLFDEGFIDQDTRKWMTYNTFIVGLAPKGKVVLWAKGPKNQKELGFFQAHDTLITKENAIKDAQYMFKDGFVEGALYKAFKPELRKKIEEDGYPAEVSYETYRERYSWRPVVILPEGGVWLDFGFITYNGEEENLFAKSLKDNTYKERAVPRNFGFYWRDKDKNRYAVWIDSFNEKEIFELFRKIGKEEEIDLTIKVNEKNTQVVLSLITDEGEVSITKAKMRLSRKMETAAN
ncbi:DUF2931 family protein [Chryseobacterium sp. MYb328]|uniref:DUF2931 family protein n=1 Tax=Chryseobacterium sp. MYb328 TaxID=2745231 RepID=UPI0030A1B176